jgi:mycoredoxin
MAPGTDVFPFGRRTTAGLLSPKPGNDNHMLIMYSTPWCGYCHRLKSQLSRAGIAFEEIDITGDPAATAFVERINGGNQTVPTVRLPDGTALTNPTISQLTSQLDSLHARASGTAFPPR